MRRLLYHLSYAAILQVFIELQKYTNATFSCQQKALSKLDLREFRFYTSRRMIHQSQLTTRSYECDSYGHVNNAVFLNYLEYARIQFLKRLPVPYSELRRRGVGFVVARICIDYKSQVGSGEALRIQTRPIQKQKVRMVFQQSIYRDRDTELVAEAEVTWACINDQGKLIRIPPELDIPELEP